MSQFIFAHSFLILFLCLFLSYRPFNCISFHKFSRQLSAFSLCSSGLISASFFLSTIYLFTKVSLSPDVILCGWLGLKRLLTNSKGSHSDAVFVSFSVLDWKSSLLFGFVCLLWLNYFLFVLRRNWSRNTVFTPCVSFLQGHKQYPSGLSSRNDAGNTTSIQVSWLSDTGMVGWQAGWLAG